MKKFTAAVFILIFSLGTIDFSFASSLPVITSAFCCCRGQQVCRCDHSHADNPVKVSAQENALDFFKAMGCGVGEEKTSNPIYAKDYYFQSKEVLIVLNPELVFTLSEIVEPLFHPSVFEIPPKPSLVF